MTSDIRGRSSADDCFQNKLFRGRIMALIVKKFGGSSVANAERVFNVSVDAYGRVSFRLTE